MDIKRKIYLTLSIIFLVANPITGILLFSKISQILAFVLIAFLMQSCIALLAHLFMGIFATRTGLDDNCTFLMGILTLGRKKIYYSDLGYFYTRMSGEGDYIIVSKQGILNSQKLFQVGYYGDIESLRFRIKEELDTIYAKEVAENKKKNDFKNWSGFIDKKSERDEKLNKILQ